jgi:hypothetical protein
VAAIAFDADGGQLAAFLDLKSFIHVWNLTPSWQGRAQVVSSVTHSA